MPSSENEEVFDVEEIVDDRMVKGKRQYLIKWVGYPSSENTWELVENLMCEELLAEYRKNKKTMTEKKANVTRKTNKSKVTTTPKAELPAKEASQNVTQTPKEPSKEKIMINEKIEKDKENSNIEKFKEISESMVFEPVITNEWHENIHIVLGAYLNKSGVLEIEFILKDGSRATALSSEIRYKAPLKILDFYESNLLFPE